MSTTTIASREVSWTNSQSQKIYAVHWPVPAARAVVCIIHGLGEHGGRYEHLARFFQENEIACFTYDRLGYGHSDGRRGDVEHFGHYLDSIGQLLQTAREHYPELPIFPYGHSVGGALLLTYLKQREADIAGAIISAPYIRLAFPPPPIKIALGKAMRKIWPTFTQEAPLELNDLSRDPSIAPAYAADPLTHKRLSARTGIDLLELSEDLQQHGGHLKYPMLFTHGDRDKITHHDGTRDYVARHDGPDLQFKSWPGLYHELHNEPEKEEVFEFVLNWLWQRL